MLTYINIKENGECDYADGFCRGSYHRTPTRENLLRHFSGGWYDERGVWIGNGKDSKARYVQDQWIKIVEEFESGDVKPGMRLGWFCKANKKIAAEIEKFHAALRNIGYDVKDDFVDKIFKVEEGEE